MSSRLGGVGASDMIEIDRKQRPDFTTYCNIIYVCSINQSCQLKKAIGIKSKYESQNTLGDPTQVMTQISKETNLI